jgi:hypothetical protein
MSYDTTYEVSIPYRDFFSRFSESDNSLGGWGETHFHETFSKYITDAAPHGIITIEYKYDRPSGNYTNIKYRVKYTDKIYRIRYAASTPWAAWWCSLTDALEDEADDEECDEEESDEEGKHTCGCCRKQMPEGDTWCCEGKCGLLTCPDCRPDSNEGACNICEQEKGEEESEGMDKEKCVEMIALLMSDYRFLKHVLKTAGLPPEDQIALVTNLVKLKKNLKPPSETAE